MKFESRHQRRLNVAESLNNVREQVELALGAAEKARETAESRLAKLQLEQRAIEVGIDRLASDKDLVKDLRHPKMSEVSTWLNTVRRQIFAEASTIPQQLRDLVAKSAPGAAGRPVDEWLGSIGTAEIPAELWRIGSSTMSSNAAHPGWTDNFDVAVPLLDESHIAITSAPDTRASVEALVENILMRVLSYLEPGAVRLYLWDVGQLTAVLPNLYPLSRTNGITTYEPTRLQDMLEELAGHVRRIHATSMQAGHTSIQQLREVLGSRVEPWRIAVLFGNAENLPPETLREIKRIAVGGSAAGISLITVDIPTMLAGSVEYIRLIDSKTAITTMAGSNLTVNLDPPLPANHVSAAATRIADALLDRQGGPRTFEDLLPRQLGHAKATHELRAPVGFLEGDPIEVVMGDLSPHALIGGPSGSGKTNFLYAFLGSLAARYPPEELALYLLDFKEGVSFAGLAPGRKDATWLPHAQLVGVNINTDREFGLALLRFLVEELRRRSAAAKAHEVTTLADLRKEDPDGNWPRIVAVIDEFQYLFSGRDSVTSEASMLLEDIARRGRSQGIHMILASQDVAGIEAFWGKPAIFEQCTLRIAMPKARRVLSEMNQAAMTAPRWHAVVNHESGVPHGNQLAHIPDASSKDIFNSLQRRLWEQYAKEDERPRLFDGAHAPELENMPEYVALTENLRPRALVGESIDVGQEACGVELSWAPGRNFAVIGSSTAEALSIMDSSVRSLARQYNPDDVEFIVLCAVERSKEAVDQLCEELKAKHTVKQLNIEEFNEQVGDLLDSEDKKNRILLLYGVDAAIPALEAKDPGDYTSKSGLEKFQAVLKQGPPQGIHTIGWWRSASRLKDTLGYGGTDDVGAWAALDVQGSELSSFSAGAMVNWSPRPGRAIFFDRTTHNAPEVIIPFLRPDREHQS